MGNMERNITGNTLPWVIYAKQLLWFLFIITMNLIGFFLKIEEEGLKINFKRTLKADILAPILFTAERASPPEK